MTIKYKCIQSSSDQRATRLYSVETPDCFSGEWRNLSVITQSLSSTGEIVDKNWETLSILVTQQATNLFYESKIELIQSVVERLDENNIANICFKIKRIDGKLYIDIPSTATNSTVSEIVDQKRITNVFMDDILSYSRLFKSWKLIINSCISDKQLMSHVWIRLLGFDQNFDFGGQFRPAHSSEYYPDKGFFFEIFAAYNLINY